MEAAASVPLNVTRLPSGGLRLDSPAAPGYAATARGPFELARAVDAVMREAACAAYARQRGQAYDLGLLENGHAERSVNVAGRRYPPVNDPASWTPNPDGSWQSPSGRQYSGDAQIVGKVKARRSARGLSNDPPP